MRVSRRIDYAIRVLIALAQQPPGARLAVRTIQRKMWIPEAFLFRIIAELSRAKIVDTFAGPRGGVQLVRDPREINLRMIWEAMEKPLVIAECLDSPEECPLNEGCPVNARWRRLQGLILRELEATTIAELAREAQGVEITGAKSVKT
ncbi:MAG: Rrf2 family transcriptional regulator [Anaerolineales bacterium]|nr:Rrf2 family transcriptional regulator [Anaerolineales bacterium]MCS7246928.1 Rrf2 family transcriptional regulator [Anaerolineales bacterium]MDW8160739.1 Rrf2 family transcriptional regulator [Anaerolineales bacterium]MDW8447492.1 Rrf2 family transcriptional regulator [Anaerolineales bacterium]